MAKSLNYEISFVGHLSLALLHNESNVRALRPNLIEEHQEKEDEIKELPRPVSALRGLLRFLSLDSTVQKVSRVASVFSTRPLKPSVESRH